ncbi:RapZ C-terminal domain-containing protein [Actinokineospora enzanensis]|uniref:RapZ C-terminal domain-containing protein n=1 Tax=Actinokineospora enzanensis TaxID=155975 RepID=UPI000685A5A8|nr:RNase adapter RapZ [Actinokineospora enzanensis]
MMTTSDTARSAIHSVPAPAAVAEQRRPGSCSPRRIVLAVDGAVDGAVAVEVESYGHLHGVPGSYDLVADLRDFIRDPHVSPQMRESTGRELDVRLHVLTTPGAMALVDHLVGAAVALLASAPTRPVRIGVSCAGGRHRSVAVAEAIAERIRLAGHGVLVTHHHIDEPVVQRAS